MRSTTNGLRLSATISAGVSGAVRRRNRALCCSPHPPDNGIDTSCRRHPGTFTYTQLVSVVRKATALRKALNAIHAPERRHGVSGTYWRAHSMSENNALESNARISVVVASRLYWDRERDIWAQGSKCTNYWRRWRHRLPTSMRCALTSAYPKLTRATWWHGRRRQVTCTDRSLGRLATWQWFIFSVGHTAMADLVSRISPGWFTVPSPWANPGTQGNPTMQERNTSQCRYSGSHAADRLALRHHRCTESLITDVTLGCGCIFAKHC